MRRCPQHSKYFGCSGDENVNLMFWILLFKFQAWYFCKLLILQHSFLFFFYIKWLYYYPWYLGILKSGFINGKNIGIYQSNHYPQVYFITCVIFHNYYFPVWLEAFKYDFYDTPPPCLKRKTTCVCVLHSPIIHLLVSKRQNKDIVISLVKSKRYNKQTIFFSYFIDCLKTTKPTHDK